MSLLCLRALNVFSLHDITCGATLHGIGLRPAFVDVIDGHGVADELRWSCRANLNFSQPVIGIQRVISLPLGLELDDLRCGALDVLSVQVCLILIEVDVECTRARPINIPV